MAAPKHQWGKLNWALNLEKLVSAWKRELAGSSRSHRLQRVLKLKSVRGTVKDRLVLTVRAVPYARIQDQGGRVPARSAKPPRRVMRFKARDGRILYRRRVKGFTMKPKHWVRKGFDRFWKAGSYRGARPLAVGWSD